MNYDPLKDFAPISLAAKAPGILVVNPQVPARSVKELVALAKAKPGQLNLASSFAGTSPHLASVLFNTQSGIQVTMVYYKSVAQGINDLLAGRAQMMFPSIAAALPHIRSGKLRALAVTSADPSELTPDIPPLAASGYPDYESVSFHAMFAPAGTPQPIITRLNREVVHSLHQADVKERLLKLAITVIGSTPEQLTATVKSEMARMGKVIKDNGIRAN